ncbi:MAG TPA: hypothetical protein VI358_20560, partial [Pseudolabrys sp.]
CGQNRHPTHHIVSPNAEIVPWCLTVTFGQNQLTIGLQSALRPLTKLFPVLSDNHKRVRAQSARWVRPSKKAAAGVDVGAVS